MTKHMKLNRYGKRGFIQVDEKRYVQLNVDLTRQYMICTDCGRADLISGLDARQSAIEHDSTHEVMEKSQQPFRRDENAIHNLIAADLVLNGEDKAAILVFEMGAKKRAKRLGLKPRKPETTLTA